MRLPLVAYFFISDLNLNIKLLLSTQLSVIALMSSIYLLTNFSKNIFSDLKIQKNYYAEYTDYKSNI